LNDFQLDAVYEADKVGFAGFVDEEGGIRKVSRKYGWGRTSLAQKVYASGELLNMSVTGSEVQRLTLQNSLLEKRCKSLMATYSQIDDCLKCLEPFPNVVPHYPKMPDSCDEEIVIADISDTQIGQAVLGSETGGLETYNFDVFKERAEVYKAGFTKIVNTYIRGTVPVKTCIVILGGDIVEGETVYPLQHTRLDKYLLEQAFEGADVIADMLLHMAGMFDLLWVIPIWGNHGKVKNTTLNMDTLAYMLIQRRLAHQTNIKMEISVPHFAMGYIDPSMNIISHERNDWPTWSFGAIHGDNIMGYQGIPAYGINRAVLKYQDMTKVSCDAFFIHHFHERTVLGAGKAYVNGSWIGGTEYSTAKMQGAARPMQQLFTWHPWQHITSERSIYLAPQPGLKKLGNGMYTPTIPQENVI